MLQFFVMTASSYQTCTNLPVCRIGTEVTSSQGTNETVSTPDKDLIAILQLHAVN